MRHIKPGPFLLALSLVLALGCGRDEPESDRVVVEQEPQAETRSADEETTDTLETQDPEIPPQQVEVVEPEPGPDRGSELDARERDLAQRQAELDARERRLRELVRAEARRPEPRRETKPAPVERRPTPAPIEERTEERTAEETAAQTAEQTAEETEEVADLPAPAPEERPREERRPESEPIVSLVSVPSGTVMAVEFLESLSSQTSEPGDIFRARISSDVTADGGQVVIPAGSEVVGVVGEAVPLRKVGGRAKLTLKFTDLVLPSGSTVPIRASFVGEGRNETGKDAATIGGAAAGGAILGRVLSKGNRSRGAVIGAIIGAVAGTAIASRTPGEEVTIARGTVVDLKLDEDVEVRLRR